MKPFWIHSGLSLLDVDGEGRLQVTDAFLAAYVARPELAPIAESCAHERALHARLARAPRDPVDDAELARLEDADARENWRCFLALRARLLAASSVEDAYLGIFEDAQASGRIDLPPIFVDQLAQILVHHLLVDCEDGLVLRVAELWFREQRVSLHDGRVLLADAETLERRHDDAGGLGEFGRLLARGGVSPAGVELEVIDRANADAYFGRDERHDFAVEITHGRTASAMLCDVIARWVGHLLRVPVRVSTLSVIEDARWRWHVGLDAQASALLDALWRGDGLTPAEHRRLLLLMRLDFERLADQAPDVAAKPVYLALAMDESGLLRMKPQNLLVNLPLAHVRH